MSGLSPIESLALGGAVIVAAYVVFGLTGFGASIAGLPFLAQLYPVRTVVPAMLAFDLCAGLALALRQRAQVDRTELRGLLPLVVAGMVLGAATLARAPDRWLMLGLGAFVLLVATNRLVRPRTGAPVARAWAWPAGLVGGALSALYGTGGPIYTMYLARRIDDPLQLRATMAVLILSSALLRLVIFTGSGLLLHALVLRLVLAWMPCALLGYVVGNYLHGRIGAATAHRLVWALIVLGGAGMLMRGAMTP